MEQAAVSFTQGSLRPLGVAEPQLLLCQDLGMRASPRDAQASHLSAFDFPLLDLFSQTLFLP